MRLIANDSLPAALAPFRRRVTFFGEWCNGSTTDSDSVSLGSNPSSPVFSLTAIAVLGSDQRRPLGGTELHVPPIVFGSAALGNVDRVTTNQAKLALCGEWFRQVAPPVWIETFYRHGDGMALATLGRVLPRLEISSQDVFIQLAIDREPSLDGAHRSSADVIAKCWDKSCRLLGYDFRPKLISIGNLDDDAWRTASDLKSAGAVRGCGAAVTDWRIARELATRITPDWITFIGGCTVMRHPPEILSAMGEFAGRQIPIVLSSIFEGGFLVGGNKLDGRVLNPEESANRSQFSWRKAFVALCDGHGISPSHACIQFAFCAPGVTAIRLESSYLDRVAENVNSVRQKLPDNFWASMKEEGLLGEFDVPRG